jgi:hypothetical protein
MDNSLDPLAFANPNNLTGHYQTMNLLLQNYYYVVYFTSKLADPSNGESMFQVNRFYSTETAFNEGQGASIDQINYNQKTYVSDISIMPWWNNVTKSGLVWMGQTEHYLSVDLTTAATLGIETYFGIGPDGVITFRYYRKLDWLLGIIGGGMLLFYLILYVPCTFINRRVHKMRNVEQLLLINHANEE